MKYEDPYSHWYVCRVLSFIKFLPKGRLEGGGFRKQDLIQVYTDPGGMRTIDLRYLHLTKVA